MPRLFVETIFDEAVNSASVTWKSADRFARQLGSADQLVFQFHLASGKGSSSPTITAAYYHSNDGRNYTLHTTLLGAQALPGTVYDGLVTLGPNVPLGAYGQVQVSLGGTSPSVYLILIACGRSKTSARPQNVRLRTPVASPARRVTATTMPSLPPRASVR